MKRILLLLLFFSSFLIEKSWATTWYVTTSGTGGGTSWANASNNLQSVISGAIAGDQIWVAAGIYQPLTVGTSFSMKDNVKIYGGFIGSEIALTARNWNLNQTILQANGSRVMDNSTNNLTNGAIIDGFTLTGAYFFGLGGGMYNNNSSPTVNNCIFSKDSANYGGGMYNLNSSPVINNCVFKDNISFDSGAGMYNKKSSPTIIDCEFVADSCINGRGGGMKNDSSFTIINRCKFFYNWSNQGGGIQNIFGAPQITNSIFDSNGSLEGGGAYNTSSVKFTNCLFTRNYATNTGAGIFNEYALTPQPEFINCTVSGNIVSSFVLGVGMRNFNSNPTLTNCILYPDNLVNAGTSSPTISYSDIFQSSGVYAGIGNINSSPNYVIATSPDGGDGIIGTSDDGLQLSVGSPCANTGNNSIVASSTDVIANARITATIVDMGAYEQLVSVTSANGCWAKVTGGYRHSIAVKTNGTLWAWGDNTYGQLGDGTNTNTTSPIQIGTDNHWKEVSAGSLFSIGLKTDGTLWAWGYNSHGELGNGTTANSNVPVQIGTANNWMSIATGDWHALALKNDSTLWSWGYGTYGALGLGNYFDVASPTQVNSLKWNKISAGGVWSLLIKNDGALWACGNNDHWMLGTSVYGASNILLQIGTDTDWKEISAGTWHGLAIKNNGTLWSWGYDSNGQLGDNNSSSSWNYSYTPTQVGTATNWAKVAGGELSSMALKTNGTLYTWGFNADYQVGNNSTTDQLTPLQITAATNWQIIYPGHNHGLAIQNDNSLWSWGQNNYGQCGQGNNIAIQQPTQVSCSSHCIVQLSSTITSCTPFVHHGITYTSPITVYDTMFHQQGCDTIIITNYSPNNIVGANVVTTGSCTNLFNGTISVSSIVGGNPLSMSIDYYDGGNNYLGSGNSISALPSGNYSISISDGNGCNYSANAVIGSNGGNNNIISIADATCTSSTGSITISTNTNDTIKWSGTSSGSAIAGGSSNYVISGLAAGNYNITVISASGCISILTATVNSIGSININLTATNSTCNQSNGSIILTAPIGATVSWNGGSSFVTSTASTTFLSLTSGWFHFTVTTANGCSATDSVQIFCTPVVVNNNGPCMNTFVLSLNGIAGVGNNGNSSAVINQTSEVRIFKHPSGNYFITGLRNDSTTISYFDVNDVLLWTRAFQYIAGEKQQILDLFVNNDGDLIGCSNFGNDGCLFKYNIVSNTFQWVQHASGTYNRYSQVHSLNATQFIATATRNADSHCIKIDKATGSAVSYSITGAGGDFYSALKNGKLYGTCRRYWNAGSDFRASLFSHNANTGSFLWQNSLISGGATAGAKTTRMYPVAPIAEDSSLVMLASGQLNGFDNFPTGDYQIALTKTNLSGNPIFTKIYTPSGSPIYKNAVTKNLINTATGYYLVGNFYDETTLNTWAYGFIIKVNKAGKVKWARKLGASGTYNYINNCVEMNGGIYVGMSSSAYSINRDLLLVKMDTFGNSTCPLISNLVVFDSIIPNVKYAFANSTFTDNYSFTVANSTPKKIGVNTTTQCVNCCKKQVSISANHSNNIYCPAQSVCLNTTVNGVLNPIGFYNFTWKDLTTGLSLGSTTIPNPCFTGWTLGTHNIQLIVSTNNGICNDTANITINIIQLTTTVFDTICTGQSIWFNNQAQHYSGVYLDTLTSQSGCDSFITLNLTVLTSPITFITHTLCGSTPFVFNGLPITSAGTYYDTMASSSGCDSIVSLTVINGNTSVSYHVAVSCNTYTLNGVTYPAPGHYTQVLTNHNGCDSTIYLLVSLVGAIPCNSTISINTPGNWQYTGSSPATSTIISNTAPSYYYNYTGTQWIIPSPAQRHTHYYFKREFYVCTADSYHVDINTAFDNYVSITLDAISTPVYSLSIYSTGTFGTNHHVNKTYYLTAGLHTLYYDLYNYDASAGFNLSGNITGTCLSDSACVKPCICTNDTVHVSGCDSLIMPWQTYTANGTHTQTYVNAGGCDSTVTHIISIHYSSHDTLYVTACDSLTWNGVTITESTTCSGGIQALDGSSTYYRYLTKYDYDCCYFGTNTVNEGGMGYAVDGHIKVEYDCSGVGHVIESTGNYASVNPVGSVYTYTGGISSNPTYLSFGNLSACCEVNGNKDYYQLTQPVMNGYTVHLTNATGCDSTVTLFATINHSTHSIQTVIVCDSFYWQINNTVYYSSGVYTHVGTNAAGCSHTDSLVLIINHSVSTTINHTTCENVPYNFNGTVLNTTGIFSNHFTNSQGCDSVIVLHLTVLPVDSTHVYDTICDGDSYLFDGNVLTTSGDYKQLLTSSLGCDSVVLLHLTVTNVYAHVTNSMTTLTADVIAGATYQWVKCPNYTVVSGATSNVFAPTTHGNYAVIVSLNGCKDTSNCTCIDPDGVINLLGDNSVRLYPNPTSKALNIAFSKDLHNATIKVYNSVGQIVFEELKLNNKNFSVDVNEFSSGIYHVEIIENKNSLRLKFVKE